MQKAPPISLRLFISGIDDLKSKPSFRLSWPLGNLLCLCVGINCGFSTSGRVVSQCVCWGGHICHVFVIVCNHPSGYTGISNFSFRYGPDLQPYSKFLENNLAWLLKSNIMLLRGVANIGTIQTTCLFVCCFCWSSTKANNTRIIWGS